jgi:hypothetical protein
MNIRHLLLFPLQFTPATRHALCLCLVLKHFPLPSAMENACGFKFTMDSFENLRAEQLEWLLEWKLAEQ